jgi:exosortase N
MLLQSVSISKAYFSAYLFPAVLSCIGIFLLHEYLATMVPVLLCGIGAVAASSFPGRSSTRYGVVMMIMLGISFLIPVKSIFYFTLATGLFYSAELQGRRIGFLGFTALIVSSPVFVYAVNAFSFPIRLQLSSLTGKLFSLCEEDVSVHGNVIVRQGNEFSVDPACMGLHMLSISILLGIFFAGLLQRKIGRVLSVGQSLLFISLLLIFNVIANLIRIVLLVQFTVLPDSIWHDITGIACLLLYVCIPAALMAKKFISRSALMSSSEAVSSKPVLFRMILVPGLFVSALHVQSSDTYQRFHTVYGRKVPGFHTSVYAPGIMKLEKADALIYVKFIRGFYDTEHNPTMCWKGSGYEFNEIKQEKIGGMEVFTAILKKEHEILYTSWWFDNNERSCTDQWTWRKDMLFGAKNYAVVNVTTANYATLRSAIMDLKQKKILSPLFLPQ